MTEEGGMPMQYDWDWTQDYSTKEEIESDFEPIKFSGPGFYLTRTDTVLIVPLHPEKPPTRDTVWHWCQPEGTTWRVFVWNCPFEETLFAALATTPVRWDGDDHA